METDSIDIWFQVRATLPALLEGENVGKTEIIRANPAVVAKIAKKSSRAHFDVVLVRVHEESANLYGVKGKSLSSVHA